MSNQDPNVIYRINSEGRYEEIRQHNYNSSLSPESLKELQRDHPELFNEATHPKGMAPTRLSS